MDCKNIDLKKLILKHEELQLKLYVDTKGKITIGVGRNLTDNGISPDEAQLMYENDLKRCLSEASKFKWFHKLNDARKIVILDMLFNLGLKRFLLFKKMISFLEVSDYSLASREMLDSDWSKQVGQRALTLAAIMNSGGFKNEY